MADEGFPLNVDIGDTGFIDYISNTEKYIFIPYEFKFSGVLFPKFDFDKISKLGIFCARNIPTRAFIPSGSQDMFIDNLSKKERLKYCFYEEESDLGVSIEIEHLDGYDDYSYPPYFSLTKMSEVFGIKIDDAIVEAIKGNIDICILAPRFYKYFEVGFGSDDEYLLTNNPELIILSAQDVNAAMINDYTEVDVFHGGYIINRIKSSIYLVYPLRMKCLDDYITDYWFATYHDVRVPIKINKEKLLIFRNDVKKLISNAKSISSESKVEVVHGNARNFDKRLSVVKDVIDEIVLKNNNKKFSAQTMENAIFNDLESMEKLKKLSSEDGRFSCEKGKLNRFIERHKLLKK